MPLLTAKNATLVIIDMQERLMPSISGGPLVVANVGRLVAAAGLLGVPVVVTEHNPAKLGATLAALKGSAPILAKMSFDACAEPAFLEALAGDGELVVCGCEAHVCVGQTVLSLLDYRRRVVLVQDAVGSRASESREVSIRRMEKHGAEIVTTEMVLFEWLRTAKHPQFRAVLGLVR